MAERPTVPDSHRPLLEAEVATLATVGPDGRPQLSEVWFLADGDDAGTVRLSLNRTRQKTRNLEARPVCSLLILDLDNPYRYLELRGAVEIADDLDLALADRVGEKYHADLRQHDRPGEQRVAVTLRPDRVHAVDMSAA